MNTVIIGGGAAGLMAAISAAERGSKVILLEKNDKLGKKIYITGKGRCNVTNVARGDEFLANIPRNPRFVLSALSRFDSADMMAFLESNGLHLKVERGGRVFPESDKASDVTRTLQRAAERAGVEVRLGVEVKGIESADGRLTGVRTSGGVIACNAAIVCTGGISYPSTGSTGDGYRFAQETGHRLTERLPSLAPVETAEDWPARVQGLTLKNVTLTAARKGKKLYSEQGELLFAHFGITGPLVLSLSAVISGPQAAGTALAIDLKPALDADTLDKRILRDFAEEPNRILANVLRGLMPASLIPVVLELAGLDGGKSANEVTRAERRILAQTLKRLPLTVKSLRPVEEAVVTRGGVNVGDIDPKTMMSKKLDGLYFAGEVLDVDGYTGGFNLQLAFTTGRCAGIAAAERQI